MERCLHQSIASSAPEPLLRYANSMRGVPLQRIKQQRCRRTAPPGTASVRALTDLSWQPIFSFDSENLMAEAPYLRRDCEDLDWKKQADDLRAQAAQLKKGGDNCNPISEQSSDQTDPSKNDNEDRDTWRRAGVILAAAFVHCGLLVNAIAQESLEKPESAEAASRAPSWLVPAVLAFPVMSYVLFNLYRAQVNPYAKVTDWMFGVVAVVIIANLILITTIGVRLY